MPPCHGDLHAATDWKLEDCLACPACQKRNEEERNQIAGTPAADTQWPVAGLTVADGSACFSGVRALRLALLGPSSRPRKPRQCCANTRGSRSNQAARPPPHRPDNRPDNRPSPRPACTARCVCVNTKDASGNDSIPGVELHFLGSQLVLVGVRFSRTSFVLSV